MKKTRLNKLFSSLLVLILVFTLTPAVKPVLAADEPPQVRVTQVDNSRFPQVTVYVSSVNSAGEPVPVTSNQFLIKENGVTMRIDSVSASGEIGPLTTLLVMDVSGSMNNNGKLDGAKSAAQAYINQMRDRDQAGLLTFNTYVDYRVPLSGDRNTLIKSLSFIKAEHDTSMYDALYQAAQIMQPVQGRKAVILLSDGLDNSSRHQAGEVLSQIGVGGLSVSAIGLGDRTKFDALGGLDEAGLKSLTSKLGGMYEYAPGPDALMGIYERFGRALQSEYKLSFTSSGSLRDGINRNLTVALIESSGAASVLQTRFNPGGVLPEVPTRAAWLIFLLLLAGLVLLFFAPALLNRYGSQVFEKLPARLRPARSVASRVKLKEAPRIKMH